MTPKTANSLSYLAAVAAATTAASLMSFSTHAESPMSDNAPVIGSRTRAEVQAESKTPFVGGNPWAPEYNFARSSVLTTEQVRGSYKMSRDEVHALTSEDSGSAFLKRLPLTRPSPRP